MSVQPDVTARVVRTVFLIALVLFLMMITFMALFILYAEILITLLPVMVFDASLSG